MYGLIFETIGSIIQADYGNDVWLSLLEKVEYQNTTFCTHSIYSEDLAIKMANVAANLIADGSTPQDFLTYFGRCFIRAAGPFKYETLIKRCGRFFCNFLSGIDSVHLHMKYRYPKMDHPFIYVLEEDADGVVIHYRTSRIGFYPYLYGLLDQVATDFYGIRLAAGTFSQNTYGNSEMGYQYRIRINFDNRDYMACKTIEHGAMALERKANFLTSTTANDYQEPLPQLSSSILLQLFPFCLIFSSDLKIIAVGCQLRLMFSRRMLIGQILPDVARLRRPRLNLTWDNLVTLQRVACELEMMLARNTEEYPLSKVCKTMPDEPKNDQPRRLLLRGEMRHMKDWQAIMYLCNPLIDNMEDMYELGLSIGDLSLHGHSRELVMTAQQHNSSLEDLYERAEERAKELHNTHDLLDEWKRRGDELLYSMIPESIAKSLRRGKEPVDTCEAFECITASFVEMTNIDDIMIKSALEAVSCMNAVFSGLDKVIDQHNVYKVETIGKVYMVVGGAPTKNDTHVKDVLALGFRDLLNELSANSGMPVEIRIGLHSGPAVAGLLGRKKPRYSFFGDTINTAARMQTTSLPGRIQISSVSYNLLKSFVGFDCKIRGTVIVKGKGEMETYWLLRYRSPPR
ncbi:soluble guanylate cyclase 89Da-like isoform X2 [Daphnia pulex]|uniref:soluble guanylate cyclase 89Da-like isoform X2 n=1 Tax=Daphnia pulex TaxID=6669 RepID=UPI001EDDC990|nr:soluble guanylate cyclase 89Da-like isoform X2 [Daphnia pulex]